MTQTPTAPYTQMPPPQVPQARSAKDPTKHLRLWQIATVVLALTTIAGLIWGFTATRNANDQAASSQAQINQLKAKMAAEESDAGQREKADAEKIAQFRSTLKELQGSLKVDTKDLKAEAAKIKALQQQYDQQKAQAAADDATLNDKLQAANSRAALAEHCSAVMASGLTKLYEDVPSIVTYREVAAVLRTASANCQGIVAVNAP